MSRGCIVDVRHSKCSELYHRATIRLDNLITHPVKIEVDMKCNRLWVNNVRELVEYSHKLLHLVMLVNDDTFS